VVSGLLVVALVSGEELVGADEVGAVDATAVPMVVTVVDGSVVAVPAPVSESVVESELEHDARSTATAPSIRNGRML
jgi:hypothetical protein